MSPRGRADAAIAWLAGSVLPTFGLFVLVAWPALAIGRKALTDAPAAGESNLAWMPGLAVETLRLVALTGLIALPVGVALAWLLARSDLPGRRPLLGLVVLALFVPLPLQALAWLGSFGNLGRSQALGTAPILVGRFGAAFVHAMAALPWVVLIAAAGLRSVEPELEESARLDLPGWRVVLQVTLRRAAGALAGAALAVAVLTAGEMTVTDLIPLRTYAEEAYILAQMGLGQGRLAVWATLPQSLALGLLVLIGARALLRLDPARLPSPDLRANPWPLGGWRWPVAGLTWLVAGSILVLPLYGLIWRAGRVGEGLIPGRGAAWSLAGLAGTLERAWEDLVDLGEPVRGLGLGLILGLIVAMCVTLAVRGRARPIAAVLAGFVVLAVVNGPARLARIGPRLPETLLFGSLLWAALGASLAVGLGWVLAWRAREPGPWRWAVALTAALLLAVPGPIAGLALKIAYIQVSWLQRTPGLMVMGYAARTLPFVLLVLWPALRSVPQEFLDAAAVDGLGPFARAWQIARPLSARATLAAWCLAFALAIGELPATYVTRAPGFETVSVSVWSLLHMGVESRLAGLGLILLGVVAAVGVLALLILRTDGRDSPEEGGSEVRNDK